MADPMKIRATNAGGVTEVRALINHPMETGQRKDAAGKTVPAHYITEVTAQHNGKTVLSATWSQSISQNPFLSFKFKGGAKGDKVTINWVDSQGDKRTDEALIT
jgi:sulfur-oxidizing protein SoxZ